MKFKIIVHALIKNQQNKVLALKRSATNDVEPGKWDIPGGSVEDGETLSKALGREVQEETGLNIQIGRPIYIVENIDPKKDTHFIKIVFSASSNNSKVTLNPAEHEEFEWMLPEGNTRSNLLGYVSDILNL